MNELTKHIAPASWHKALLFVLLVLALASVADRYCQPENLAADGSPQTLTAGLPLPGEDTGNRAGSGVPSDEGAAAQLVQFVLQKDNGSGRTRLQPVSSGRSVARADRTSRIGILCTTAPMISSDLGRQFTLVGAKPSGTS